MKRKHEVALAVIMAVALVVLFGAITVMQHVSDTAEAQSVFPGSSGNNSVTGSITAATGAAASVDISLGGRCGADVVITGTWVATLKPQISVDGGTTYIDTEMMDVASRLIVKSTTGNSTYLIRAVSGASNVRLTASAYTSGTATVTINTVPNPPGATVERDIDTMKSISASSGTADVTVWTPATGRKVRIFGLILSTTVDTTMTLVQGQTPTTLMSIRPGTSSPFTVNLGPAGFLINTADATVAIQRAAATILNGAIWGREE